MTEKTGTSDAWAEVWTAVQKEYMDAWLAMASQKTSTESAPKGAGTAGSEPLAQGLQSQRHRGGMVGEVVDHRDAAGLTDDLLAAFDAFEPRVSFGQLLARRSAAQRRGGRRDLVVQGVGADQRSGEGPDRGRVGRPRSARRRCGCAR